MSSSNCLADAFLSEEAQKILKNRYVLLIGDSVIRSMYKDLVKFLQSNEYLSDNQLKVKGEFYFENDTLLEGGQKGTMSNDISYTEVREYKTSYHFVKFYFITRCYSDYLKSICDDIKLDSEKPDVVIMNSGCWDLTRYGQKSIYEYKQNLPTGIYSLIKCLPSSTLFIWTTTLPLSKDVKGGFMIPEVEGLKSKLREDVLEANYYAAAVIDELKLDVLDLHYFFHNQIQRRAKDGIHWDSTAHRRITNLILHHICDSWDFEIPGRLIMKDEIDIFNRSIDKHEYYEEDLESTTSNSNNGSNNSNSNNNHNNNNYNMSKSKHYNDNNNNNMNQKSLPNDLLNRINEIKKSDGFNNINLNDLNSFNNQFNPPLINTQHLLPNQPLMSNPITNFINTNLDLGLNGAGGLFQSIYQPLQFQQNQMFLPGLIQSLPQSLGLNLQHLQNQFMFGPQQSNNNNIQTNNTNHSVPLMSLNLNDQNSRKRKRNSPSR